MELIIAFILAGGLIWALSSASKPNKKSKD
jgi:hypothetical protein